MQARRMLTLHTAIRIITKTVYFKKLWVSISSLETAIQVTYKLEDMNVSKASISRTIGWLNAGNNNLDCTNPIGIYSGSRAKQKYFYFMDPPSDPPYFSPVSNNDEEWNKIDSIDQKQL